MVVKVPRVESDVRDFLGLIKSGTFNLPIFSWQRKQEAPVSVIIKNIL